MNYIKHLTGFFDRIVQDRSLNPTHISLYISLFQFWNVNRFQNPISITRDEVMRISKICSKATYHKCMRELNEKGYIKYEPSFNPFKGSMVILFNFSEDLKPVQKRVSNTKKKSSNAGQVLNKHQTSNETSTEQALVPSINYINKTNISNVLNLDEQPQNFENKDEDLKNGSTYKKEKSSVKKEKEESCHTELVEVHPNQKSNPILEEVKSYFLQQNFPELEANKFFNYFSSNGWLVGGKTPMVDWQASAKNWMLNSINFKHNADTTPIHRAKHLNTGTDKDYSEPL
ncbi:transcriptional regulator [Flavobacterium sp. NG2]|uniref:transcriptional regulator n=1 Tax=Flavobacterium sp. NG2 TaxID=3097547 RepID=UPI002A8291CA|nr:transcriptional regulator [Flavobacterium sp. NG2]WPR73069.1 transcriptional regulator [Flavobacterium sp. NG2]